MQATAKASDPGLAHYRRVGAPTGRMTARPHEEVSKEKKSPLMADVFLFSWELKGQPQGVQSTEMRRLRSLYLRVECWHQTACYLPSVQLPMQSQPLGTKGTRCLSLPILARKTLD